MQHTSGALCAVGMAHLDVVVGCGQGCVEYGHHGVAAGGAVGGYGCILHVDAVHEEVVVLILVAAEAYGYEAAAACIAGEVDKAFTPVVEVAGQCVDRHETAPAGRRVHDAHFSQSFIFTALVAQVHRQLADGGGAKVWHHGKDVSSVVVVGVETERVVIAGCAVKLTIGCPVPSCRAAATTRAVAVEAVAVCCT